MSGEYNDEVQTGSFNAAGAGAWQSVQQGHRLRVTTYGTFTGLVAIIERSSGAGGAGTFAETVATLTGAETRDLTNLPAGYYRIRVTGIASGSVTYHARFFRPTPRFAVPVWDDLRAPASSINPAGPVHGAGVDTDDGCLLFDASTEEMSAVIMQMPHAWVEGSNIRPHVHWTKTTSAAGGVVWKLEYQIANIGGTFSGSWTTLTGSTPSPINADTDTANQHLVTDLGEIAMDGYRASCMFKFRISRLANDVADTYAADAKLMEFDIHYLTDGLGSGGEFIK